MTTAFIIRFHYNEDDPRFKWRFEYFNKAVLPKILKQKDQDFDICIRCNPVHNQLFMDLCPKIKTFQVKNEQARYFKGRNNKQYFEDHVDWCDVIGLEQYDLQIGLDSDDLIDEHYVELIKKEVAKYKEHYKSLHICFQPMMYRLKNGKKKAMMAYTPTRGSAFMALYQPDKINYKFIYCMSHISLCKLVEKSVVIPQGHCWATAHNINESTGKK